LLGLLGLRGLLGVLGLLGLLGWMACWAAGRRIGTTKSNTLHKADTLNEHLSQNNDVTTFNRLQRATEIHPHPEFTPFPFARVSHGLR
jgi:hypothetical protein